MKKILIIAILLSGSIAWAQDVVRDSVPAAVADSADAEENVIGAKPAVRPVATRREANVLGAPVYYNVNGSVRGSGDTSAIYRRPKHHYLNNLDDRYCSFFAEGEALTGASDLAYGLNFTYLPKRWGAYGSLLIGLNHDYLSAGPVLRLSDYESMFDWQLYGGVMFSGRSVGGEVGVRIAVPQRSSEFCLTSVSMGCAIVGSHAFVTVGASVDIIAIFGLATFLLW